MLPGGGSHPRREQLEQIHRGSYPLITQLADFKEIIRDRRIVSFYETSQTRQPEFVSHASRLNRTRLYCS